MILSLLLAEPANPWGPVIPIVLIFGVFYFLILRPQQKRAKEQRAMLDSLKAGDQVVTIGGLRGTVASVDQDTVVLRAAENVKLTFSKSAVAGITQQKE